MQKISFLFAHRTTDVWSTPLSIVREFEDRGWEVKIYSLFESDTIDQYTSKHVNRCIEELNSDPSDILMFMDWGRYEYSLNELSKFKNVFKVMESGDDPQNFNRNVRHASNFDLILSPDYQTTLKYKQLGHNAFWWTHFADTRIHHPIQGIEEKYVAVSSRGRGSSQVLDFLSQAYPEVIRNENGWQGIEHSKYLQKGKIVIQHSRHKEVTRRIFEAMACNRLVLTDRLPKETKLDELFVEGQEIVFYNNLQDCLDKIRYYNENEYERMSIANAARKNVLANHTQVQRVNLILDQWKNYQLVQ